MNGKNRFEQGQIVLITLLVLAIATTVALSLIARTTVDTSISTQTEESARAFSAAEAGIEEALLNSNTSLTTGVFSSGASYSVMIATISGTLGMYEVPQKTLRGQTETIWLVNHDATTQEIIETPTYTNSMIGVCWSKKSSTEVPAIIASVLYKQGGIYKVSKVAIDPDATRSSQNHFINSYFSGGCGSTTGTDYKVNIIFNLFANPINSAVDTIIALRLRPVYFETKFVIDTGVATLPSQGKRIESTGSTVAGVNRKIVVYQQYRSPSTIFDAAVYSEGGFIH